MGQRLLRPWWTHTCWMARSQVCVGLYTAVGFGVVAGKACKPECLAALGGTGTLSSCCAS